MICIDFRRNKLYTSCGRHLVVGAWHRLVGSSLWPPGPEADGTVWPPAEKPPSMMYSLWPFLHPSLHSEDN